MEQIIDACAKAQAKRHRLKCTGKPREKVFGAGRAVPLDRNEKARIWAYAQSYTAAHRKKGEHRGPITRAHFDVLRALLWEFHNQHTGLCFPSRERIAKAAKVHRDTVGQAIAALENARVMTWQHRLVRQRVRVPGLFGMVETYVPRRNSNAYRFRVPRPNALPFDPKSENPAETETKRLSNQIPPTTEAYSRADKTLSAEAWRLIRSGIGHSPDVVR